MNQATEATAMQATQNARRTVSRIDKKMQASGRHDRLQPLRDRQAPLCAATVSLAATWRCSLVHDPRPFLWHTPAQEIIANVRRRRAALTPNLIRDGALAQPRSADNGSG
jgi:hypothetical protein